MKDQHDNLTIDGLNKLKNKGGLNELALFAGAGGGILGSHLLGWNTVCAVERDAYAAQVLAQRQNDGILAPFPIWSDIATFDGKPWKGIIDVIFGGFPCQDISSAGKGAGINGERSGLWVEMARIVSEVRPQYVFVENSPMLVSRGLTRVISDLAEMGYDAQWARFSASNFGARPISVTESGLLPTPKATDCRSRTSPSDFLRKSPGLETVVNMWPTPKASDWNKRGKVSPHPRNGLAGAVMNFPTPMASDANKWSNQTLKDRKAKGQQVRLNTAVAPEGGSGGRLNPDWVEWLMGWPIGWTDLKPLEMDKFQSWQKVHLSI